MTPSEEELFGELMKFLGYKKDPTSGKIVDDLTNPACQFRKATYQKSFNETAQPDSTLERSLAEQEDQARSELQSNPGPGSETRSYRI